MSKKPEVLRQKKMPASAGSDLEEKAVQHQ
jgi:hypothetical protein